MADDGQDGRFATGESYAELVKREPRRTGPNAERAIVPLPNDLGFTAWEHWAWTEIACGRQADMSQYDQGQDVEGALRVAVANDPAMGMVWPEHRMLSDTFLKLILFHEPWMSAATHDRIEIVNARFTALLDFRGQRARGDLRFYRCRFEDEIDLTSFSLEGQLSLHRCWLGSRVKAEGLFARHEIVLRESEFRANAFFMNAVTEGSFTADKCRFEGELNAQNLSARGDIYLDGCRFRDDVRFSGAQTDGVFNACNAEFDEALECGSLSAKRGIYLRTTRFKGAVRLLGAQTLGQFSASNATFDSSFQGSSLSATSGIYLDRTTFRDEARFISARTEGQFSAENAVFEGNLIATWLKADNGVFIRGGDEDELGFVPRLHGRGATVRGELDLSGAEIGGGRLDLRGLDCVGKLNAEAITSRGVARLDLSVFGSSVSLVAGRFERNLTATGAQFLGEVKATNLKVENDLLLRSRPDRRKAGIAVPDDDEDEIRGAVALPGPVFRGPVDLVGAEIGGTVDISGATFHNNLNLTSAQVRGDLLLASSETELPNWRERAQLNLRNCKVRAIQATAPSLLRADSTAAAPKHASRKDYIETDLSGIEIEKLSGADEGKGDALLDANPRRVLVKWIEAHADYRRRHDPGPYHQIAKALDSAGRPNAARIVLIKGHDHEVSCRETTAGRKAVLVAWNLFSRYGFSGPIPLFWLIGLILTQMGLGLLAEGWGPSKPPTADVIGEWFIGATSNLVPIVDLDPVSIGETTILERRFRQEATDPNSALPILPHWLKQVWFWSAVMGFVVLSYLAAAITGLSKIKR